MFIHYYHLLIVTEQHFQSLFMTVYLYYSFTPTKIIIELFNKQAYWLVAVYYPLCKITKRESGDTLIIVKGIRSNHTAV